MNSKVVRWAPALPVATALMASISLAVWWVGSGATRLKMRVPGADQASAAPGAVNPVAAGKVIPGAAALSSEWPGLWPGFRGPKRDGAAVDTAVLARVWEAAGPRQLWAIDLGEGYAGAAVANGKVYLMDYDRDQKQSLLRCLSLATGQEHWRYSYPLSIKRNHGMTRTVPAVSGASVVGIDAKCNVLCLSEKTGELRWGLNMVHDLGATIPPWYTGQCPLVEDGAVILAPGGRDALLAAVDLETGKLRWKTPNPRRWKMTHSSVMPFDAAGQRSYVYCGSGGVVSVSAKDGSILWDTTDWKISIATVPSPLVVGDKIFLSGGYNAGSAMLQVESASGKPAPKTLFRLGAEVFGATQHTPDYAEGHIFGTRPDGQFVCLDLSGKVKWSSGSTNQFGLGSFLLANGLFFALNDSGKLSLFEANPGRFTLLAQAQVLHGRESWAPMALAGGRLLVRDLTRLVCLDVAAH